MLTEDTHEVVPLFTITQEDIDSMEVDGTPQEGVYPLAKIFEEGIYKVSRKAGDGYTYYQYSDYLADPVANPRLTPSGKFEIYCQTRADALNATGRTEGYTWKPYPSYKTPVNGYEATFSDWENKVKGDYPYQIFNPHYLRRSHTQFDNLPWRATRSPTRSASMPPTRRRRASPRETSCVSGTTQGRPSAPSRSRNA